MMTDRTFALGDEELCVILNLLLELPDDIHPLYHKAFTALSEEADRRGLDQAAYMKECYNIDGTRKDGFVEPT